MAKYDVFISYSRKDSNDAIKIVSLLQNRGIKVWYDQDGILSGEVFKRAITNAIINSSIVLFLSSVHSNKSDWTAKEVGVAIDEKKIIIPVRLDATQYNLDLRLDLVNLDYINYYDLHIRDQEQSRLLRTVDKIRSEFISRDGKKEVEHVIEKEFLNAQKKTRENKEELLKILKHYADLGSVNAQINLGISLLKSQSIRLENEGFRWLVMAAKSQNALAFYNVGLCYEKGIGITMDKGKSLDFFRKAAMMGHPKSQYRLGLYYIEDSKESKRYYEDIRLARHWLNLAAGQNYKPAIVKLAELR